MVWTNESKQLDPGRVSRTIAPHCLIAESCKFPFSSLDSWIWKAMARLRKKKTPLSLYKSHNAKPMSLNKWFLSTASVGFQSSVHIQIIQFWYHFYDQMSYFWNGKLSWPCSLLNLRSFYHLNKLNLPAGSSEHNEAQGRKLKGNKPLCWYSTGYYACYQ